MKINPVKEKPFIYGLSYQDLLDFCASKGLPKFAAGQVYDWLYKKFETDPENWSNLSKKSRHEFKESFDFLLPTPVWDGLSVDGTRKFLLKLYDGNTIESVVIPSNDRLTICISSQVGCAIGCTFCHTGTQGLTRNLMAGEIVGQLYGVTKWLRENTENKEIRLTNIVYMGQGEPLHNYDEVKKATEVFLEDRGLNLSQRKITLSTSGLVPQIEKLVDFPPVNIAISLHAAYDDVRSELMPINKVYDLQRLFNAIRSIPLKAYRRITYEYILIDEFNNSLRDIDALCSLLDRAKSKINIIPFNEYPGSSFRKPSEENVLWFMRELNRRGYTTTVRQTKGDDILAACGQLKTQMEKVNTWANLHS